MLISKNTPWVAFFSHSGSEIVTLSKILGRYPDLIITDSKSTNWHKDLLHPAQINLVHSLSHKLKADEYIELIDSVDIGSVITLHGWMNIVPAKVCERYTIYNGHPALCNWYPELKGKDMQDVVVGNVETYPRIGSIVHEVTPVVDDGPVITTSFTTNRASYTREQVYEKLRHTSLVSWLKLIYNVE